MLLKRQFTQLITMNPATHTTEILANYAIANCFCFVVK